MVLEARQTYRVQAVSIDEINRQLQYLADRLDLLESLRGTARHYGDLVVDGDITCEGGISVIGDASLGTATIDTMTIDSTTVRTLTVEEIVTTLDEVITGSLTLGALLLNDSYVFPTEYSPAEQSANFYSALIVHGNMDIGGDVVTGGDLHVGGDVSISGSITANSMTVHADLVLVDDNGQQVHGWTAP